VLESVWGAYSFVLPSSRPRHVPKLHYSQDMQDVAEGPPWKKSDSTYDRSHYLHRLSDFTSTVSSPPPLSCFIRQQANTNQFPTTGVTRGKSALSICLFKQHMNGMLYQPTSGNSTYRSFSRELRTWLTAIKSVSTSLNAFIIWQISVYSVIC